MGRFDGMRASSLLLNCAAPAPWAVQQQASAFGVPVCHLSPGLRWRGLDVQEALLSFKGCRLLNAAGFFLGLGGNLELVLGEVT